MCSRMNDKETTGLDFAAVFQANGSGIPHTFTRSSITDSLMWDVFTYSYVILVKLGAPFAIVVANIVLVVRLNRIWSRRNEFRRNLHPAVIAAGVSKVNPD